MCREGISKPEKTKYIYHFWKPLLPIVQMRKVIIIAVDIFLTLLGTSNSNINEVEVLAAYTYYSCYI